MKIYLHIFSGRKGVRPQKRDKTLREDYELTDRALLRMAKVINAADTNNFVADPLATGFEAIAVGYSLRFPNDLENINRQFEVYDALYAWCRLDIARSQG